MTIPPWLSSAKHGEVATAYRKCLHIDAPADKVFDALTPPRGLQGGGRASQDRVWKTVSFALTTASPTHW